MREDFHVMQLRKALRRRGVWGRRAESLLRDWTEHVREDIARRVEEGTESGVAEKAAWLALGAPDVLALHATHELSKGSWLGRHPWLAGVALPILGWMGLSGVLLFFCAWLLGVGAESPVQSVNPAVVEWWPRIFNGLPWGLSIVWLAWVARRMPGGWRLLGMTTGVLALCSTALHMSIQAPVSGPGSGQLMVGVQGPGGLLVAVLARLLGGSGFGTWSDSVSGPFAWAQSAVLLIGGILVRLGPTVWAWSVEGTRCAGEESGG
jgi:hypothetical protein